jgi:hypothetical protein
MHPMFKELFIDTDAEDLLAGLDQKIRRITNRRSIVSGHA